MSKWRAYKRRNAGLLTEYLLACSRPVNAAAFGASTDLEDNTPAFQAAIDFAVKYGPGVDIPRGTWKVRGSI